MNDHTTTATPTTVADTTTTTTTPSARYLEPGWIVRNVFNRAMRRMTLMGISVRGSRELRVRGRVSGEWRAVPVNPLTLDLASGGRHRFLVAPRGTTEWVRNIRVAGGGELRVGSKIEAITVVEVADDAKPEILREYLHRWKAEVGAFFDGVGPTATDAELAAIASGYPVFEVTTNPSIAA